MDWTETKFHTNPSINSSEIKKIEAVHQPYYTSARSVSEGNNCFQASVFYALNAKKAFKENNFYKFQTNNCNPRTETM